MKTFLLILLITTNAFACSKSYSVKEIDDLRQVCENIFNWGIPVFPENGGMGRVGDIGEREAEVESRVRTFMLAGITAKQIEDEYWNSKRGKARKNREARALFVSVCDACMKYRRFTSSGSGMMCRKGETKACFLCHKQVQFLTFIDISMYEKAPYARRNSKNQNE